MFIRTLTPRQPVLFIGHGSPMNAIQENAFTRSLTALGRKLQRPRAVLCVSAHWMTQGTWVTHMARPKTIHDFYGFPKALFEVQYPAPGSPELATQLHAEIQNPQVSLDDSEWGLDHGTWGVLRHLFPGADVPVVQMSLDLNQGPEYHFRLGQELQCFRDQGVLIVGRGNIVHNLREVDFDPAAKPFDWASEFDEWVKERLLTRDFPALTAQALATPAGRLSIPTPDHWYPLLYTLGAATSEDRLRFEYEGIDHRSISMRCFQLGATE